MFIYAVHIYQVPGTGKIPLNNEYLSWSSELPSSEGDGVGEYVKSLRKGIREDLLQVDSLFIYYLIQ